MDQTTTCTVPGCSARVLARGVCKPHYRKLVKYGDPLFEKPQRACSVDGCDRRYHSNGYCELHYGRWRRTGDAGGVERRRAASAPPCDVAGCEDRASAKGFCPKHYQRFMRFGDATYVPGRAHPDSPVRPCKWCDRVFDRRVGARHLFCSDDCAEIVKALVKRLSRYSMNVEQYKTLWRSQEGKCRICDQGRAGRGLALTVDHDHACCGGDRSCGRCVRGLLCDRCNNGLGCFKDDAELIRRAAEYVARSRGAA